MNARQLLAGFRGANHCAVSFEWLAGIVGFSPNAACNGFYEVMVPGILSLVLDSLIIVTW